MYSNIIVVCYAPGARGNAIGHIIELSPSIHNRNTKQDIVCPDANGTMHNIDMRFGLWPDAGQLGVNIFANDRGFKYQLDLDLSSMAPVWQQCMSNLQFSRYDPIPLLQGLQTRRIVTADHIRSIHALQLMPGCRPVAVTGDPELALRLLWAKWELQPPPRWHHWHEQYPNTPMLDLQIAEYEKIPIESVTDQLRAEEWEFSLEKTRRWHEYHRTDPCAFSLDFQSLFDQDTSYETYHKMVDALELEPNWTAVSQFIDVYNAAQPKHL